MNNLALCCRVCRWSGWHVGHIPLRDASLSHGRCLSNFFECTADLWVLQGCRSDVYASLYKAAVPAVGGQSYRQCWADIIQKHGHVGLYKGLASGLVGCIPCAY